MNIPLLCLDLCSVQEAAKQPDKKMIKYIHIYIYIGFPAAKVKIK